MDFTSLKKALVHFANIEVETESGIKQYKLVLDFNAIARAQEELGKDFALFASWVHGMTSRETVKLCHFALSKYHPDIRWEEVCSWFSPEHIAPLNNLLIELAFPGTLDRINKSLEDKAKGEGQDAPAVAAS
jgi:hypothetical protein